LLLFCAIASVARSRCGDIWLGFADGQPAVAHARGGLGCAAMSPIDELARLLELARLTHVVDIGANPVDGAPPYKALLDAQLCRLTGFEPQDAALAELNRKKGANETYLPYAVGDGGEHTLNLCAYSGWTSLFTPSAAALEVFSFFKANACVVERARLATRRLDDIAEIDTVDFLKIDIQGGELAVFVHGREKLKHAVVIQTEVQFVDLYDGQPSFGQVDQELRAQGFIPHAFAALKKWPIAPLEFGGDPRQPLNQLLEADIVYVRDFVHADRMSSDQLKHLALIAHACYGSFDLAGRCVALLEQRGALPPGALARYVELINRRA
jgi:FkbM family methyltransferase